MTRVLLVFIMIYIASIAIAQPDANTIQVIAKPKKNGVWIRWAPANQTVWQLGNKFGYIVERFSLNADGEIENLQGIKISEAPFKPLSSVDLLMLSSAVEEAEVLNELIYGTSEKKSYINDFSMLLAKKEDIENRFGVALLICDLSVKTAKAAGLFTVDSTAVKGRQYIYRVKLAQQPEGIDVKPGVIVVDVTDEQPLTSIKDLQSEFRDRSVLLSWSTMMHHGIYSFYYVEKSVDGKNFKRVSDLPYAHMSESPDSETAFFVDSLDTNTKTYFYRIAGVTPFAETGPSSNVVKGEGKNSLSGLLIIREGIIVEDKTGQAQKIKSKNGNQMNKGFEVKLTWEFPGEEEKQIGGFVISRAAHADGPYIDISTTILPASARTYSDNTTFHNTYYLIRAVDKNNQEVAASQPYLVQAEDNEPPQIPVKLLGLIAPTGIVSLSWEENRDTDLMGYRLFRANSLHEEPVEITTSILKNHSYSDTINMDVLNKKIFYYVVAVDKNFNASGYSAPLVISRPDKRPPVAPVFTRVEILKDSIILEWQNSSSDDVAKYKLIRIGRDLSRTMITWTQTSEKNSFFDRPDFGKVYQYKVIAEDSSGNVSEAITRKILFEPGYRKAIQALKARTDRENGLIALTWINEGTPMKCFVYRKENNGRFILYKTMEGNVNSVTDKGITNNNIYHYKVQIVYPSGVKSTLSEAVEVVY